VRDLPDSQTQTRGDVLVAPPPVVPTQQAAAFMQEWGWPAATIHPLASERDANLLIDGRYVLKVSNPAEDPLVVDMENAAMTHALRVSPGLPVPVLIPTASGATVARVVDAAGRACLARLFTVVPGRPAEGTPVPCELAEEVGALAARTSLALQGLFHRGGDRVIDWDVRRAPKVLAEPGLCESLGDFGPLLADMLPRLAAAAEATGALAAGLNHADVTLTNILLGTGPDTPHGHAGAAPAISGLIDFGDMHHTAHVCDLAVTLTSVLRNTASQQLAGTWDLAAAVLVGYQRHRQLTPQEVAVLGDLVVARLGLTLAISRQRSATHQDNLSYISQYDLSAGRVLEELLSLGPEAVTRRLHTMAGTALAALPTAHCGAGDTGQDASGTLLERRRRVTGGPLSPLFYTQPLEFVRGEGPWLFTLDGTRYLDAYNNVAVVGHAHPTVVQSVSRQLALINSHSRYLHQGIVELAERLLATVPDSLDTVLFTTSGTEANELAWRMATACTGGNAAIIAEHAYHGSSKWMADLSSNEWPRGYHPAHVGTFAAPRPSTGGLDRQTALDRVTTAATGLTSGGDRAALVLADLGFTSEGILDAPVDFAAGLLEGAHRAGALFLADEVQSGYGRVGPALWRFAAAGITPDFVTLGKPMGAGYPVGALITRREISDSLARDYEYFSTFAATPGAAAAGLAVLDVLQHQAIPEQAVRVGEHLRERLRGLARRHSRLGEVRGTGLLAGVDILASEGAQDERASARTLLDALSDRHVLAGLTGPTGSVLKIRPPLIWREEHADQFTDALNEAVRSVLTP
jgi:4-aminobutyrate aminotransferase-like enzyme/Ser/Thr protein kinase RdoA (MazF antagonist)